MEIAVRNKILILGMLLICSFWPSQVFAKHKNMIVVPPKVDYESPCENKGECALLYAGVGRNIYFNMKSSIERFNNLDKAKENQLRYKALTIVSPGCRDNWKIERFHKEVINSREKLINVCEKFQSNLVIWAELGSEYKKKLDKAIREDEDCFLYLTLKVYEAGEGKILSRSLVLTFTPKYNALELGSQQRISDAVLEIIEGIHFEN